MNSTLRKFSRRTRAYNVTRTVVQDGLAATPSDMQRSCNMGVPISSQLLSESNFDDGEISQITDVPFLFRRGVDVGDIIAYEEQCKGNISEAYGRIAKTS